MVGCCLVLFNFCLLLLLSVLLAFLTLCSLDRDLCFLFIFLFLFSYLFAWSIGCCDGMGAAEFSSHARIMGKIQSIIHSLHFIFIFLIFMLEINATLLGQGPAHSGSASSDNCRRAFPGVLRMNWFPWRGFTPIPGQHNQPTPTYLGHRVHVRLALYLWQNDQGLSSATSVKNVLNWANVCSPNIFRTVRRTMNRFLIELLVCRSDSPKFTWSVLN